MGRISDEDIPRRVLDLSARFRSVLAEFDPGVADGDTCAALAEELARTANACEAARTRAAARAAQCGAHRTRGYADASGWLARVAGTTSADAKDALETTKVLETLAETSSALERGEVSLKQAAAIARAEQQAPGAEHKLLELAKRAGLSVVRDEARRLALAAGRPEDLAERQRKARFFRHWTDSLGMTCFSGALPPVAGAALISRVEATAARIRRGAGPARREEPFAAHAADALVALTSSTAPESTDQRPRTEVVLVCDLEAYRRGHAHPGEPVQVLGGSPVPVAVVKAAMSDAFVKAVLYHGKDITTVAHFGRHLKAELRTAIELGRPPDFPGAACSCGRRFGLELDHVVPYSAGGATSYDNLDAKCRPCHSDKTERDRQAGLMRPGPSPPDRAHGP